MRLTDIRESYEDGINKAFFMMEHIESIKKDAARSESKEASKKLLIEATKQKAILSSIQAENRRLDCMMINKRIIQFMHIKNSLEEQ